MMLVLVGVDQERQKVEMIGLGTALFWFAREVLLDLRKGRLVLGFSTDGATDHRMVSGLPAPGLRGGGIEGRGVSPRVLAHAIIAMPARGKMHIGLE